MTFPFASAALMIVFPSPIFAPGGRVPMMVLNFPASIAKTPNDQAKGRAAVGASQ